MNYSCAVPAVWLTLVGLLLDTGLRPGDTYPDLARHVVGAMFPVLSSANHIAAPHLIEPGQTLLVPDLVNVSNAPSTRETPCGSGRFVDITTRSASR